MNDSKKRRTVWNAAAIGLLGALVLPGCSAAPDEGASQDVFHWETAAETRLREQTAATPLEDGVPGEAVEEALASGAPSEAAANCVYIQWCNEPGSWGSVCRVRSSCLNQCNTNRGALYNECTADAYAVCGGITQPAVIRGCP